MTVGTLRGELVVVMLVERERESESESGYGVMWFIGDESVEEMLKTNEYGG